MVSKPRADAFFAAFGMHPCGFECRVPIVTASLNESRRSHWATNMRRVKSERRAVSLVLSQHTKPKLPVVVTLTRHSVGKLDGHDNLIGSFKHCVDAVAGWLGIDDADDRVTWKYEQARATKKTRGTTIRVETNHV